MSSFNLPLRPAPGAANKRNQKSRSYFMTHTAPPSTEAINGPVSEPARDTPADDKVIVGVDFGTTFSG